MKHLIGKSLILIFALALTVPMQTGCSQAPSARVQAVQTLGVLGSTAKAGIDGAALLLKNGKITVKQWQDVAAFYDQRWQPAYNLAVLVAKSDLSSVASQDLQKLANEFMDLISKLSAP